jgi:ribosomal protein S18 acetylase RimI-like enzyme
VTAPVSIRTADLRRDGAGVLTLDTSFATRSVFDVRSTGDGFTLVERQLSEPLTKRLPLDDLSNPKRGWSHAFVAEADGGLAGFAAAGYEPWNRRLTLWHLYIRPDLRRQGVGRRLVERVEGLGRELGARHVWLETSNLNVPAVTAYRALGFTLTGVDATLYDGTAAEGEIALFFSKPL